VFAALSKPVRQSQLLATMLDALNAVGGEEEVQASGDLQVVELAGQLPLRILLAEDNIVNQRVAQRMLTRLGYGADVVANGLETIEALRRQRYDVVLMDMQMPEMGGLEATAVIRRELPADHQPYIIAMTANVLEEDRDSCLAAGMDAFISKPVHIEMLTAALLASRQPVSGRSPGEADDGEAPQAD
jgi:CheY-like chemotaxis protein